MPKFDVRVYAVESDEYPGLCLGETTLEAVTAELAAETARTLLWDDQLSATCDARCLVNSQEAMAVARQFIDSAPEDTLSVEEYDWEFQRLSKAELLATGLAVDLEEHARNIALDPKKSDLTRPVVVSKESGERFPLAVWDGVHRIMSALVTGQENLPAIMGTRKSVKV